MLKKYAEWEENKILNEMSARRSFWRTISKFVQDGSISTKKPIAILTAFRQEYDLHTNRKANKRLEGLLRQYGLSFYPIIGAGQEPDGEKPIADEESYVIQPISEVPEEKFLDTVRSLLLNPTGEGSHTQWGAVVKLPSQPEAFLLHHNSPDGPSHHSDYSHHSPLGMPRIAKKSDQNFTQMLKGPRLDATMQSVADKYRKTPPGRRFTL